MLWTKILECYSSVSTIVYLAKAGNLLREQYFSFNVKAKEESPQQGQGISSGGQQQRRGFVSGRVCSTEEDDQANFKVATRVQVELNHAKAWASFI